MRQRFLILQPGFEPFTTNWFDAENNYIKGMIVFDIVNGSYTVDGVVWSTIKEDHL